MGVKSSTEKKLEQYKDKPCFKEGVYKEFRAAEEKKFPDKNIPEACRKGESLTQFKIGRDIFQEICFRDPTQLKKTIGTLTAKMESLSEQLGRLETTEEKRGLTSREVKQGDQIYQRLSKILSAIEIYIATLDINRTSCFALSLSALKFIEEAN